MDRGKVTGLHKNPDGVIFDLSDVDVANGRGVEMVRLTERESELHMKINTYSVKADYEAARLRDAHTSSDLELPGTEAMYQVDSKSLSVIERTLRDHSERGEPVMWRLSDNTWRETTLPEMETLLAAYSTRERTAWNAFAEWDSGDKSEPFELELS